MTARHPPLCTPILYPHAAGCTERPADEADGQFVPANLHEP